MRWAGRHGGSPVQQFANVIITLGCAASILPCSDRSTLPLCSLRVVGRTLKAPSCDLACTTQRIGQSEKKPQRPGRCLLEMERKRAKASKYFFAIVSCVCQGFCRLHLRMPSDVAKKSFPAWRQFFALSHHHHPKKTRQCRPQDTKLHEKLACHLKISLPISWRWEEDTFFRMTPRFISFCTTSRISLFVVTFPSAFPKTRAFQELTVHSRTSINSS